jgi:predicted nucleic acid-binding protein
MNEKTSVYLDNCCFNRPFDEQIQDRVILETEAKMKIQAMIKAETIDLIWSYMLDYENWANPFEMKRNSIRRWKLLAIKNIKETENLLQYADRIALYGINEKDAVHIACAIEGQADYFLTTDIKLARKSHKITQVAVCNPMQFFIVH